MRPHLEYASSVWDPYLKKNIEAIEHVQKFALKVCWKDWHSDYVTLLNATNVPPLAARRKALKLCQLFSILQGHSEFPDLPTSKRVSRYLNCIRSTNSATLTQPFAHTTLFQNFFSPLRLNYGTLYLLIYVPFSLCHILSRLYLLSVVLTVMYLFNSKIAHSLFLCFYVYVLFLCITSLLLDTRLVLAYMLSLMSGHNKFIM